MTVDIKVFNYYILDGFFKLETSGVRPSHCKAEKVIYAPQLQHLKEMIGQAF